METDTRRREFFQLFERTFFLLRDSLKEGTSKLSSLEKEMTIRNFRQSFQFAWYSLQTCLEAKGELFYTSTPRQVLKDAVATGLLTDGQVWIEMLDHRNLLSHTYDVVTFEAAVEAIYGKYLPAMDRLHQSFEVKTRP
jgi:nucleotidyltransferase substrate binding protein (TIGR01987 family)